MLRRFLASGLIAVFAMACRGGGSPTTPTIAAGDAERVSAAGSIQPASSAERPPFNLEAILRGDGFGLVKFRQQIDPAGNIIDLDVWVRDLSSNMSYSLQRATDTVLDGTCTGTNWLTLGKGPTPEPIVTDERGTGRAELWRDLSAVPAGMTFDIHFRIIENATTHVALQSDCYRFVVRN